MRLFIEKICLIYTALFMTVASVPRCDVIIDALGLAESEQAHESCHDEDDTESSECQCQVHFAYLCLPDQLYISFDESLNSVPMIHNDSIVATPSNFVGDSLSPPPRSSLLA
ncbi:hypothetical protein [Pseudobacteriovorax antillogorgiicola]|uniref:Uncharacterized protein n=1 Tax=Pseudobacteriovorax antillogorgiicola TaxID=1513793 RepID=A0A1Y6BGN9_9BACT|nr:hypothetical protein [Pseudobacteriovorax antillogorgiicola]TCS56187.1 hypothetical protein EDD56_1049 [Pseudobacteriovorax antillogorgiicola]SMF08883.1 hypothetical protein SAMN06296036_104325 [Pseudobacteriovorax antillogorgiicola]